LSVVPARPEPTELPDPADLPALRAALAAEDPEGRLHPVGLHRVVVDADAVHELADVVADELERAGRPADGPVVVLGDATTIERDGDDLKALVGELLGTRFAVRPVVLRGAHATLHVDDEAMDAATAAVEGAACVVSVGGGTVSDIAKVAVSRTGDTPLVVVQTAASVDGYADDVSVVLRGGVKRTIPSRWPSALVVDLTTVAQAPDRLTAAGYGEVLSLFTAPADWYLASIFGLDDTFHPVSRTVFAGFDRGLAEWSAGVGAREPAALEHLVRTLAIRGILGGVTGTTACLSGTEHLVSHLLDMYHDAHDRPVGLHGAQVGVGSVVSAAAWAHLLAVFDPDAAGSAELPWDALFPDPASRRDTVFAAFADVDPSGTRGRECWNDYEAKLTRWREARPTVEAALRDWDRHRAVIEDVLVGPDVLRAGLEAAGAAGRFADLDPAVDDATAHWAVSHCHLMRNRFTVIDLLDLLGRWTEEDRAAVLAAADTAPGGV
jgi:glycerol-1-phosphate dehydrogenase [NAD(P)+]